MKAKIYSVLLLLAVLLPGCEPEDNVEALPFVAGFERESYKYSDDAPQEITLVFSKPAEAAGTIQLKVTPDQSVYGVDFSTTPEAVDNLIALDFTVGQSRVSFTYHNLMLPYDDADLVKKVQFEVVRVDYAGFSNIQGYTLTQMTFSASLGAILVSEVGGPNQGNQVFVDLSEEMTTESRRDIWDLGFYGGDHFRVTINGSIYMAARNLNVTDIDAVTPASVSGFQSQVAVGTFDPENENYIDAPNGNILETAIDEISANDEDNKVYLVNLGYKVGNTIPPAGSVAITGDARGWKKIRILREGEGYRLQYANLNSTTHQEISIPKDAAYNFTFFSFDTNQPVLVEPEKAKWDLCFTVFTNVIAGAGSYGYSDFVLNNLRAGVKVYRVNVSEPTVTFANFTKANVNDALLQDDQRVIGADWRDVFSGTAYADRFYVLKDIDGNYYKIRMLGFLSEGGERGYPKFEYKLLP
ncbi:HmuY family protein [Flavobacterium caeni]|uniref:HmuY protein n=1 Tax=Flavobacterium caeni TaxID=490189 RepID=A0A1G5FF92_9FLAO|nr:HmuY family protein [Flavobacterium caeni]SCY37804.1 HmuY protein [Flavobacterium caeni]